MLLPKQHTRTIEKIKIGKNGKNREEKIPQLTKKTETAGTSATQSTESISETPSIDATKSAKTAFQERIKYISHGLPYDPNDITECTPEQEAKIAARVAKISKKLDKRFEKIRRAEKGEFYK